MCYVNYEFKMYIPNGKLWFKESLLNKDMFIKIVTHLYNIRKLGESGFLQQLNTLQYYEICLQK